MKSSTSSRYDAPTFAALRIVSGFLFSIHGVQKIFGVLGSQGTPSFGSQLWIGGVIELASGALIATGLFTRTAAFLASGTMAVAYIQFHWKFAWSGNQWLPAVNKGELAALYAFLFLFIAAHGAGTYSLDARRTK